MVITLIFLIFGAAISYLYSEWWQSLPSLAPYSFVHNLGLVPALVINIFVFALIVFCSYEIEKRCKTKYTKEPKINWRIGPWPLLAGAAGLALLNYAMLAIAGYPWGIISGYILWGTKWFSLLGFNMQQTPYIQHQMARLSSNVWSDVPSIMDFGVVVGAMISAGLSGYFKLKFSFNLTDTIMAVIGGFIMGYGAVMAFGCNIGALFSGIASGSLHGWVWLIFGFSGNIAGLWLRQRFDVTT
jgi:uncharacterized protein